MNFVEWVFSLMPKCRTRFKRKADALERGKNKIEDEIDLVNIVRKLFEIDRLKECLFDDD